MLIKQSANLPAFFLSAVYTKWPTSGRS